MSMQVILTDNTQPMMIVINPSGQWVVEKCLIPPMPKTIPYTIDFGFKTYPPKPEHTILYQYVIALISFNNLDLSVRKVFVEETNFNVTFCYFPTRGEYITIPHMLRDANGLSVRATTLSSVDPRPVLKISVALENVPKKTFVRKHK